MKVQLRFIEPRWTEVKEHFSRKSVMIILTAKQIETDFQMRLYGIELIGPNFHCIPLWRWPKHDHKFPFIVKFHTKPRIDMKLHSIVSVLS